MNIYNHIVSLDKEYINHLIELGNDFYNRGEIEKLQEVKKELNQLLS